MDNKVFSQLVSSLLTIIGGVGLLILNIQDGKPLMIILAVVILVSGVGMLLNYYKGKK